MNDILTATRFYILCDAATAGPGISYRCLGGYCYWGLDRADVRIGFTMAPQNERHLSRRKVTLRSPMGNLSATSDDGAEAVWVGSPSIVELFAASAILEEFDDKALQ